MYVETISDEAGFAELAGSWDELVRAMPRPSPFLLHSWLLEWWRHYGRGADLAVHVAYRGDHLVGALPLCTRRRLGLRVSEFVGGTWAILADALVAPGEDAQAVVGALAARAVEGKHDFADLFGLPGSSRLVAALPQDSLRLVQRLEAPVCDLGPSWEAAYTSRLSSKTRSERRRRLRQLEKLGTVESEVARSREEIARAVEDAFVVHDQRWSGRRDASGFITETGKRFHRAALLALADQDVARGLTIRLDGRPIAFSLYLQLAGRSYGMNMAFDPAYAPVRPRLGGQAPGDRGVLVGRGQAHRAAGDCRRAQAAVHGPLRAGLRRNRPRPDPARPRRNGGAPGRDPPPARPQTVEDRAQALRPHASPTRVRHEKGGPPATRPSVGSRLMPETVLSSGSAGSRCPCRPPAAGV